MCAVEVNAFCARRLMQRQNERHIPLFPIWDDVRTFDGLPWRGFIDVVSGGFPCQRFSNAHHGCPTATDLWPEYFRIVGQVQPRFVFAENVKEAPILAARRDLESIGYRCRHLRYDSWFSGAPHSRARWWLVGDSDLRGEPDSAQYAKTSIVPGLYRDVWTEANLAESLRMDDGLAYRMDRNIAIGNGQVSCVAALAWKSLTI